MKKKTYLIGALLGLTLAISGCSNGDGTEKKADAAIDTVQVVTEAQENMQALTSYGFTMDMTSDTDMGDAGEMNMAMKTESSVQTQPEILMKMDSNISLSASGMEPIESKLTQYIQGTDENVTLYQNVNEVWSKMIVVDPATMEGLTSGAALTFAEYVESAEVVGEEKIGDVACQKIDVVLSGEGITQLMGELEGMTGGAGIDAYAQEDSLDKVSDIPITLWIGKDDNQIYRQRVDMSTLMKEALLASLAENGDTSVPKEANATMILDITFHSFNTIDEIVIPEEAKNAPELQV